MRLNCGFCWPARASIRVRKEELAVREILNEGIDWTLFVRKALEHGLAGLSGHTLARVAPDMVPGDILSAFGVIIVQAHQSNQLLFDELCRLSDGLASSGIEAIPLKGPVLAIQAYGDLGLRSFRDLDFLVRDFDLAASIATLHKLGYERRDRLTAAQFDLIHKLQGQEILFRKSVGTALEPHTRLTPNKMALDVDYAALWNRARKANLNGRTLLNSGAGGRVHHTGNPRRQGIVVEHQMGLRHGSICSFASETGLGRYFGACTRARLSANGPVGDSTGAPIPQLRDTRRTCRGRARRSRSPIDCRTCRRALAIR